jgi:hypothetical protein
VLPETGTALFVGDFLNAARESFLVSMAIFISSLSLTLSSPLSLAIGRDVSGMKSLLETQKSDQNREELDNSEYDIHIPQVPVGRMSTRCP